MGDRHGLDIPLYGPDESGPEKAINMAFSRRQFLLIPYIAVLSKHLNKLPQLPLPSIVTGWLVAAITSEQRDESADEREDRSAGGGGLTTADALSILPLVAVIVGSSIGMVKTAELLGARWVSQLVIGTFVVATLTGLPNLIASVRLATNGRGAALSNEAFNSNTLNLLVGACLPTFFVAVSPLPHEGLVSCSGWLPSRSWRCSSGSLVAALVDGRAACSLRSTPPSPLRSCTEANPRVPG